MKEFADGLVLTDEEWQFLLRHIRFIVTGPTKEESGVIRKFSKKFLRGLRNSGAPLACTVNVSRNLRKLRKRPDKEMIESAREIERILLDCSEFSVNQLAFLFGIALMSYRSSMEFLDAFESEVCADSNKLIDHFKRKSGLCRALADKLRELWEMKKTHNKCEVNHACF